MPELSHIDPRSASLLVMDYQVDALTRFMTAAQSSDAIARVPDLIATARDAGMRVIHVVVAFRPGYPEVSPRNLPFRALMANGMLAAGSEGAAIHPVLSGTNKSLAEIAVQTGFSDQAALTRTFANAVGAPPAKWRREHVRSRNFVEMPKRQFPQPHE